MVTVIAYNTHSLVLVAIVSLFGVGPGCSFDTDLASVRFCRQVYEFVCVRSFCSVIMFVAWLVQVSVWFVGVFRFLLWVVLAPCLPSGGPKGRWSWPM